MPLDYTTARAAQQRVNTLSAMLMEARDVRDAEVLALLREGAKKRTIAREIDCSEGTVRLVQRNSGYEQ